MTMTRTLLITAGAAALVSLVCLGAVQALGGFHLHVDEDGRPSAEIGPRETRDLAWSGTEALRIENSAAEISYTQGPTPKFTVTGPKNRIDQITIDGDTVKGSNVHWSLTDDPDDQIRMVIVSPRTRSFHLDGEEMLHIAGYDQDSLEIEVSGAAKIDGAGHAKTLTADLSGAAALDLSRLPVDEAKVDISGAGAAKIDPKQSADVTISGAGNVRLLTRPPRLRTRVSGIGRVSSPAGAEANHIGGFDSDDASGKPKSEGDN